MELGRALLHEQTARPELQREFARGFKILI
jgi:hypothetical protein